MTPRIRRGACTTFCPLFWHTGLVQLNNLTRGDTAFLLVFGSAVGGLFSIAVSHILLGAAIAWLFYTERRIRFPRPALAVACFFLWTIVSLAASASPAVGWPQVRKFYVWLMLGLAYTAVRRYGQRRALLLAISAAGTLSACWSLVQFAIKYRKAAAAGRPFYEFYVADRITGFMSHWMTFSGEIAIALAIVLAWLLFDKPQGAARWIGAAATLLLATAQLLGLTRSMWAATAISVIYLIWRWKPRYLLALPLLAAVVALGAPEPVGSRIVSLWRPSRLDSNQHRVLLRATGLRIVAAHPVVGVGPEQVKRNFLKYTPPEAPSPWPVEWYYDHLHNIYIHYAAERGIPALLALLAFFAMALRQFWGRTDWPAQAAAAALLGIMVGGWGEVNMGDSEVLSTFLAVIGCSYAAPEELDV